MWQSRDIHYSKTIWLMWSLIRRHELARSRRLVVKVGFIMLTFGKPSCRSHFWMWSSSSAFFTALSPTKHIFMFYLFLHLSVGGKHGDIKSREVKLSSYRLKSHPNARRPYNQLLPVVHFAPWHDVCGKHSNERSGPSVSISNSNVWMVGFPSMSRDPWRRENKIGMDIFLINL